MELTAAPTGKSDRAAGSAREPAVTSYLTADGNAITDTLTRRRHLVHAGEGGTSMAPAAFAGLVPYRHGGRRAHRRRRAQGAGRTDVRRVRPGTGGAADGGPSAHRQAAGAACAVASTGDTGVRTGCDRS
ncbi:hypothetical protein GCM10010129_68690 [Streptomyces fumigatiscleroticus]|nr:hypothetical protein GCM10010129_68690 [Streptomyces fumigatiscleroticus]